MNASFGPVAEHYDQLMRVVPYRMWVSYYLLLLSQQGVRPKRLLDVCCGTGTMAELLADEGFEVAGFDLSAQMVEQAREKAKLRLRAMRYEVMDAASFDLGEQYDAAYSFFDSLNYITDPAALQSAFHRIAAHLPPGGSLVFDLNTQYAFESRLFDQKDLKPRSLVRYEWKGEWDPESRLIRVFMRFWTAEGEFTETHVQRAYSDDEVRGMLDAAGFEDVQCYHSYTLDRPRGKSDRVHYAALRADR